MCGISGLIGYNNIDDNILDAFNNSMLHRGPDGHGSFKGDGIFLGHRRLSIIDLEEGVQPMYSADRSHVIIYNGELYNYKDLRFILEKDGYTFQTKSDTEVVLLSYMKWGEDCVQYFRGMFSFCIANNIKKVAFLARDHFGIKPLIYHQSENGFCFASELSTLKELPFLKFNINLEALDQYFWHQYIPAPNTIFEGFHKLQPGHYLTVNFNGQILANKKYWHFKFEPDHSKSFEDWKEETDLTIRNSVEKHLVSDVPFGAFLSGGIDSSLIVSYMSQIMDQPVKTFSIGFADEQFNELKYARKIAKKYNTEHYEQILEPNALEMLPDLVSHYAEPFGDSSALPTYYVSQLASRHVKMVLSGDGGDEGFGGYESYLRWFKDQSYPGINGLKKLLYPIGRLLYPDRYLKRNSYKYWMEITRYLPFDQRKALYNKDWQNTAKLDSDIFKAAFKEASSFDHLQKAQYMDLKTYLPNDILTKVDIASMMNSLEVRTPLIDIDVWNMISKIPSSYHLSKNERGVDEGKIILKELLASKTDYDFAFRKKQGFSIPLSKWFKSKPEVLKERIIESTYLGKLLEKSSLHSILDQGYSNRIWLLLFLDEWLNQFHQRS
ncbi:MAG: asparagine synthase (glutamine-hydrolyzing) [bacterium]|nr:asparagine synthase (glutamine-hydrolyzing) [bacterium]